MNNADKPAYPIDKRTDLIPEWDGLTKREYFAALAMQGLTGWTGIDSVTGNVFGHDAAVKTAIAMADELLKQLEKK